MTLPELALAEIFATTIFSVKLMHDHLYQLAIIISLVISYLWNEEFFQFHDKNIKFVENSWQEFGEHDEAQEVV